ncbi:MAG: NUDIX domain-containing protein [Gammaproteobacteria bacterium]|nr:NUDIX domain-containing protein [Gammaproteobacteria bacterium]
MDSYSQWQQAPALLLTTRSRKLRNHPGQWALPGGRIDQGETALVAAKREALEEIDLVLNSDALLGRLDDFVTRSGFVMSPVVFWGGKAESLKPNPDEVDSIHRIPVAELMREDSPILDHDEVGDDEATIESTDSQNRPVLRMPIGEHWIAAPTAAVLYQFREVCILGKATRVAHFDQPRFAWK